MAKNLPVIAKWPTNLPLEIAEYNLSFPNPVYSLEEICGRYDVSLTELQMFQSNKLFKQEVIAIEKELSDSHSAIKKKAAMQLSSYLDNWVPRIMADTEAPVSEKVKLFQFISKLAGTTDNPNESAKLLAAEAAKQVTNTPSIVINLSRSDDIKLIKYQEKEIVNE